MGSNWRKLWSSNSFLWLWIVISFGFSLLVYSAWMIQLYWLFSSHERGALDSGQHFINIYSMIRTYAPKYLNDTLILILLAISSNWKDVFFLQRMSSCFRAQRIMFTHNCIMGYVQVIQGHCFVLILLMEEILHQLICSLCHYLQVFMHPGWCRISSINSSIRWVEVLSISSTLRIQISIIGNLARTMEPCHHDLTFSDLWSF